MILYFNLYIPREQAVLFEKADKYVVRFELHERQESYWTRTKMKLAVQLLS
jgi:hypothetical protein